MNDPTEILKAINKNLEETKARLEHIQDMLTVVAARLENEKPKPRSKK